MTPDPIADELARLRGEVLDHLADIREALERIRADINRPAPVETIDLGPTDEWMFAAEEGR